MLERNIEVGDRDHDELESRFVSSGLGARKKKIDIKNSWGGGEANYTASGDDESGSFGFVGLGEAAAGWLAAVRLWTDTAAVLVPWE